MNILIIADDSDDAELLADAVAVLIDNAKLSIVRPSNYKPEIWEQINPAFLLISLGILDDSVIVQIRNCINAALARSVIVLMLTSFMPDKTEFRELKGVTMIPKPMTLQQLKGDVRQMLFQQKTTDEVEASGTVE